MDTQWRLRLVTAPTMEPVSLDEARSQVRVDLRDEDALIDSYISAVRIACEQVARRSFVTQTWDLILDSWPDGDVIELPLPPLQSVSSISYIDAAGVTHTMPAGDTMVDADGEPGRVFLAAGKGWPSDALRAYGAIRVRFVAGWATPADVPAIYKQAILLGVDAYYNNRSEVDITKNAAIMSLLMMDRGDW